MQVIPVTAVHRGFGKTSRRDNWWAAPLGVFLGLSVSSSTPRGRHSRASIITSVRISRRSIRRSCGAIRRTPGSDQPAVVAGFMPFSPALLILPFPGGFRFTCYYYRGAYYKAFWADPPSCAVGEPRKSYLGENSFPLILQNVHRYFMYVAIVFLFLLSYDVWLAMWFDNPATGAKEFGIGVGTIVLLSTSCCLPVTRWAATCFVT